MIIKNQPQRSEQPVPLMNDEIREKLRQRAQKTARSVRWNRNILLLTWAILTATTVTTLNFGSTAIAEVVAVTGLITILVVSAVQGKRLERQFLEDEVRDYSDLLSSRQYDQRASPIASIVSPLSERELEVLKQVARGNSNKRVAIALSISDQTVKNHLTRIFEKLHVTDRTSAVLTAVRNGWIKNPV